MSLSKSQAPFWYNSLLYESLLDEMRSYLNETSHFFDNATSRLKQSEPFEFDDPNLEGEYAIKIERYESQFPRLLGASFVVALASLLELELLRYCDTLSNVGKLNLKMQDLRGPGHLEQFKVYLAKVAQVPFDFTSNLWHDIRSFVEVRNAIVHNEGIIDNDARGRAIKSLNSRYPTLIIVGDRLYPTMPFCNQMIQCVYDFLEHLKRLAYESYK
jgi:hypothetical protein